MLMTLKKCSNASSFGKQFEGQVNNLYFMNDFFVFGEMHSSSIKSIDRQPNQIIIITRNSVYEFVEPQVHKEVV